MAGRSKASQALSPEEVIDEELEEVDNSAPVFDINKYKITATSEVKTLSIDGTSFEVTLKPLSWSVRNQILSKSIKWDNSGNTSFDGDSYVRECLKEMILEAPWGRTTEAFLVSIDARLGSLLETLVPKAFEEEEGVDVEKIKDGF